MYEQYGTRIISDRVNSSDGTHHVVDEVVVGDGFVPVRWFAPVSVIQRMFYANSLICRLHCMISPIKSFIKLHISRGTNCTDLLLEGQRVSTLTKKLLYSFAITISDVQFSTLDQKLDKKTGECMFLSFR
jgi:hypothetical protein